MRDLSAHSDISTLTVCLVLGGFKNKFGVPLRFILFKTSRKQHHTELNVIIGTVLLRFKKT